MTAILSTISDVVEEAIVWVGKFVTCITTQGNELLLLFVIIAFVGLGVGLLSRLIRL